MFNVQEYYLKSGLLDRQRKLVICEDYIEFETGDFRGNEFTRFNWNDIIDFKHGFDRIVWYKFSVGRIYSITFKNKNHQRLRVTFANYFGKNKDYHKMYSEIINFAWDCFHSRIVAEYLERIGDYKTFSLQGITVSQLGVKLRNEEGLIPWAEVEVKNYRTYYALFQKGTPEVHSRISLDEFESETLWSVVKAMKTVSKSSI
jgi:hypothetical protein